MRNTYEKRRKSHAEEGEPVQQGLRTSDSAPDSKPFDVVVAAPLSPRESGGPATHLRWLLEAAPRRAPQARLCVVGFWEVRRLPPLVRHGAYLWRLWRAARKAHLIYALDPFSVGVPARVVALVRKVPLVLRVPGDFAWEQGMLHGVVKDDVAAFACGAWRDAPFGVRLRARLQQWVAKGARRVIAPSRFVRDIVRCWGVPEERIVVVPSMVRLPSASGNKAALRAVMGIEGPLVIAVGRLVPWKHFALAVRAMRLVRRRLPSARLIIVGDGPERDALASLIAKEGLKESVQLAGALPSDTTHRYIEAADVLVLPSTYEGLSHTLLEAMALGTVVVASRAGGNTELIAHEQTGFLVPPHNERALAAAILRALLLSKEQLDALIAAARTRTQHIASQHSEKAIFEVWRQVLH